MCIKIFENEFMKWASCFEHMLSASWLPHEYLHEFWNVFTNALVLTLVDVPWGFELLETIYQFSLMFLSCVTLPWHHFSRTWFDSHSRSHFAYVFRQYDWGIFLWFVKPNDQIALFLCIISFASPFDLISVFLDLSVLL